MSVSLTEKIEELLAPSLRNLGYDIVCILLGGGKKRPILEILIERQDGEPVSIEDCQKASRTVSVLLDVEDPLPGSYMLAVSSPGLERPLIKKRDFERFKGFEISLETHTMVNNQKRFRGVLKEVVEDHVLIRTQDSTEDDISIEFHNIRRCKLLVTEDLFKREKKNGSKNKL